MFTSRTGSQEGDPLSVETISPSTHTHDAAVVAGTRDTLTSLSVIRPGLQIQKESGQTHTHTRSCSQEATLCGSKQGRELSGSC